MHKNIVPLIVLTVAIGFVTHTVTAEPDNYDQYAEIHEKFGQYHVNVNEIVNEQIKGLINFFDESEELNEDTVAVLRAPTEEDMEACEENENLSTTCLELKLTEELNSLLDSLADAQEIEDVPESITDVGLEPTEFDARTNFLEDQREIASTLKDQTVNFYRQILLTYPLHREYEKTIESLQDYASNLRSIKNTIEVYPSKFHDASTTQCT